MKAIWKWIGSPAYWVFAAIFTGAYLTIAVLGKTGDWFFSGAVALGFYLCWLYSAYNKQAANMEQVLEALEWIAAQLRAALAERPERPERELDKSSVCEDIQQLCINGDLPWQFEDVIDWITKGEIPAQPPTT